MYNFQYELRQALLKYALLPALLISVLSLLLIGYSWNHYVVERNAAARQQLTEKMTALHTENQQLLGLLNGRLQQQGDWHSDELSAGGEKAALYDFLYRTVNKGKYPWNFYIIDKAGHLVLGSKSQLPAGLDDPEWGIMRRLQEDTQVRGEFLRQSADRQDFVFGQAVWQQGVLQGYVLLTLPGDALWETGQNLDIELVVTDERYNKVAAIGNVPLDGQGKLAAQLAATNGNLVEVQPEIYYVTQSVLPQGVRILAINPVRSLLIRYLLGSMLIVLLFAVLVLVILGSVQRESRLRAQTVEKLTAAAEVRQLESQFNPHFLFNTLENIKFMVKLNPQAAVRMIKDLSALLRYSINNSLVQVRLSDDLEYVHRYMEIQQYRFGQRLLYEEQVAEAALDCEIPKLLMQPVLENAIKYGADKQGKINISLLISRAAEVLQVDIIDSGAGFTPEALTRWQQMLQTAENLTEHTGLFNIHRRIQLLYGAGSGVQIIPRLQGTCVRLRLLAHGMEEE